MNAVRMISTKVKNYERKELDTLRLKNNSLVTSFNKLTFEVKQKEQHLKSLMD